MTTCPQAATLRQTGPTVITTLRLTLIGLILAITAPAIAAQKTAVFPFDIRDAEQEGEVVPVVNAEDLRRLKVVADELKLLLSKDSRYEVLELSAHAAEIEKASPFNKCDGCEIEIAKQAGADIAVSGFADKLSDALISLQLFVRDVKTGQMTRAMSAEIRGNTDELWLHGIRWLWRNRFNPEEKKN